MAKISKERHWSERLAVLLQEAGFDVAEPTLISGHKLSVRDVARELNSVRADAPFDVVTVQAGTWELLGERTPTQLVADFGEVLAAATRLAGDNAWHTVLVEPNTLSCDSSAEVQRMNMIRSAAFVSVVERGLPHIAQLHDATVEAVHSGTLWIDEVFQYGQLSAAHAQVIFGPVSHLLTHSAPNLPDSGDDFAEEDLRSLN